MTIVRKSCAEKLCGKDIIRGTEPDAVGNKGLVRPMQTKGLFVQHRYLVAVGWPCCYVVCSPCKLLVDKPASCRPISHCENPTIDKLDSGSWHEMTGCQLVGVASYLSSTQTGRLIPYRIPSYKQSRSRHLQVDRYPKVLTSSAPRNDQMETTAF